MKSLYQKTFDKVRLPEDRAGVLRAGLASRCSQKETEAEKMNKQKFIRRPFVLAAAILLICALSVTAFAYGGRVYQTMTGGVIEVGLDEKGNPHVSSSLDMDNALAPVEARADGRVYLVVNGENRDITDEFSCTKPYIYECTDDLGKRHAFIIGGEPDAVGWSEFIWDETGTILGGNSMFATPGGADEALWFRAAMKTLGLPW